ncbi:SMI1/KNR4 family protein [Carboxylicivirga taeanensis]|uniref:SMI1/KNR4 family protein n=1 Tax=Carboxylicivirga taeanensis TaxID=1416875 RepID=UPI003F6DECA6
MKKGIDFFRETSNIKESKDQIEIIEESLCQRFPPIYRNFLEKYDPILIIDSYYDEVRDFEFPMESVFISSTRDFKNPMFLSDLLSLSEMVNNKEELKLEIEWLEKRFIAIGFTTSDTKICVSCDPVALDEIWEYDGDSNDKYKYLAKDIFELINKLESKTPSNKPQ